MTERARLDPHRDRAWHAIDAAGALAAVGSDAERGLASGEARLRLERFGPNALAEPKRRSAVLVFAAQFRSPLIYLLFVAAGIALLVGHASDAAVISVVVVLNALIGSFQEGRAERSLQALRKLTARDARVVRDGSQKVLPARNLVPGDVLLLEAGDAVTGDARLLDRASLQIAEAALTGESAPVSKQLAPLAPDTPLADRTNMVYAGTHVTAGRARAVVVATGPAAEIGRIAQLAEAAERPKTPLERRIARFGRQMIAAAAATFVAVNALGLARGIPASEILMIGISLLVGIIPEGLPVAMTIALAVGVQRMARRKTIVRRLAAVETLGSTSVICSDKTGTLTRNEMTATELWLPGGRRLTVTGAGYAPEGEIRERDRRADPAQDRDLITLLEACVLCNDARLQGPRDAEPRWQPIGDPTEVALLALAIKGGLVPSELRGHAPRRAEIPFEPDAKMMATQHDGASGARVLIKGAPEVVLPLCAASHEGGASEAPAAAEQMAAQALRVLAFAVVERGVLDGRGGFAALRGRARLLGLVGQLDPPRPEVKEAVARCRAAGIRPVMVTGDHRMTGLAIARTLGIANDGDGVLEGAELEQLGDAALADRIEGVSVFARVHPAHKLRIVAAYQGRGEVVAMTGDGVNDAPALARADVGVAMGASGTEVAKEAAKIVIGDDNFATIVAAVEEGRVVHRNLQKAVLLLLSTGVAEVLVLLLALLLGYPPPFAAVQILWNNLVTEGLITVNLVMEPPEGDEMRRRPISVRESLITRTMVARMAFMVPAIVLATLGWFATRIAAGVPEAQARTEAFTLLAICEWFNVLSCRSETRSALGLGLLRNRWLLGGLAAGNLLQIAVVFWAPLGRLFQTVPFGPREVVALAVVGSLVLWVEEARKWAVRARHARRQTNPEGA
ncbi:MAG TPA: HAD-IC family P-type ATPase [Myxococcota bacterium]|nr:HAD-IC family P-type ATPase [Myxococcota bacterium]